MGSYYGNGYRNRSVSSGVSWAEARPSAADIFHTKVNYLEQKVFDHDECVISVGRARYAVARLKSMKGDPDRSVSYLRSVFYSCGCRLTVSEAKDILWYMNVIDNISCNSYLEDWKRRNLYY